MKPNMTSARPMHHEASPTLVEIWSRHDPKEGACAFQVHGKMPAALHYEYGAPDSVWLTLDLRVPSGGSAATATLQIDVQWFNKTATRLAEASWVSFVPAVSEFATGWRLRGFRTELSDEHADDGIAPTDVVRRCTHPTLA